MNIINLEGGGVQLNPLNHPLATALIVEVSLKVNRVVGVGWGGWGVGLTI